MLFATGKSFCHCKTSKDHFTAGGFFDIKNLFYSSNDFPQPIQNGNMKMQLENNGGIADNTSVDISSGHIEVGKDPVDFSPCSSVILFQQLISQALPKEDLRWTTLNNLYNLEPGTSIGGTIEC